MKINSGILEGISSQLTGESDSVMVRNSIVIFTNNNWMYKTKLIDGALSKRTYNLPLTKNRIRVF